MPTIQIKSSAGPYNFYCARGALSQASRLIKDSAARRRNGHLRSFLAAGVATLGRRACLGRCPAAKRPILFDDKESSKRLATVEGIARNLVRAGADRHAVLVAVGGGVVGDVAGFAAASYLRGVRLVHIPDHARGAGG